MNVGLDSPLTPGSTYTMSIRQGGVLGYFEPATSGDSLTSTLDNSGLVDLATNITVTQNTLATPYDFNVTFTYSGDGTDQLSDVFNEFVSALASFGTNWTFVLCVEGTQAGTQAATAGAAISNAASSLSKTASSLFGSPGSLWAIAVIALIVVFLLSGGPSLIRPLVSRATA